MSPQSNTDKEKKLKYVRVYDRLYEMIQNQTFLPGSQLPAETDLAEQMQVSRMTLRKALALLQEDNLITNKTGVGSFVNTADQQERPADMNMASHPVHQCCTQAFDQIELAFRIEPPTSAINKMLEHKSPAVVIADRWYKHQDAACAYSLSFIPIEVIGQEELDLNVPEALRTYLEEGLYKHCSGQHCTFTHSTAGNFTAAQYTLSHNPSFILIQETVLGEQDQVLVVSKHYIPIEQFKMELHLAAHN